MAVKMVGFTGETRGAEARVAEFAPVVVLGGDAGEESGVYVATGLDWSVSTLRQAASGDEDFMSFNRPAAAVPEGATLWLAGGQYVRMLRSVSELSEEAFKLGAWQTLAGGFRWSTGSRRAFRELFDSIASQVAVSMHRALFDPLEKSLGFAGTLFQLLEASIVTPSSERALDRALYFYENRDRESFEWVREESVVVDGLFTDLSAFDEQFAERRSWLLDARWSEGGHVPWAQPRNRAALHLRAEDAGLSKWIRGVNRVGSNAVRLTDGARHFEPMSERDGVLR